MRGYLLLAALAAASPGGCTFDFTRPRVTADGPPLADQGNQTPGRELGSDRGGDAGALPCREPIDGPWEKLSIARSVESPCSDEYKALWFVDACRGWVLAKEATPFCTAAGRAYSTEDGGKTWAPVKTLASTSAGWFEDVHFLRSADTRPIGFVVGNQGVVFATEGGEVWRRVAEGTTSAALRAVCARGTPSAHEVWAVGTGGTVLRRDSQGTWAVVPVMLSSGRDAGGPDSASGSDGSAGPTALTTILNGVAVLDSGRVVAVGASGTIITSSDGGATWQRRGAGLKDQTLHDVSFAGSDGFAVGDGGTILESRDSGQTWIAVDSGTEEHLRAVHATADGAAFAVGDHATLVHVQGADLGWAAIPLTGLDQAPPIDQLVSNLHFVDKDLGYVVGFVVGSGAFVLKTVSGFQRP